MDTVQTRLESLTNEYKQLLERTEDAWEYNRDNLTDQQLIELDEQIDKVVAVLAALSYVATGKKRMYL